MNIIIRGIFALLIASTCFGDTPPTVISVNGKLGKVVLSTTDISEGTNLYFTNLRAVNACTGNFEPPISSGTTSQYWRGDKTFQTLSSSVVPEGSNLYFTNGRAQAAVSATSPLFDTAGAFSIQVANGSQNGYLSSSDWNTFNNKQGTGLDWLLNGNAGTTPGTNFLGTTDAQSLVFKTNSVEAMRIDQPTSRLFVGTPASIGGSNAGIQYADATTANRGQIKLHSYFNGTSIAGVSTLTSRSGTVGTNTAVVAGQDYSKWTAQAAATTPGSAPISGTWSFKANTVNSLTVTSDFHLQLANLAGTLADRLYLTSEGLLQLPGYGAGYAQFDGSGNVSSVSIPNADSTHTGFLTSTDWSTFNSKEPSITAGTTAQYWRGDKTFQTLNTLAVPELTNLYFTNARAQSAISATAPLTYSLGVVGCPTASGSQSGCLSASDWSTFNNKLSKVSGNYVTNPDAEIDVSGWNLYNDAGRTVPASVTNQDITYTSALSGAGGNGATISYTLCGSSYVGPIVTCPSGTAVQVCWYNGPTLAQNPTATVLKAAYDATSCAVAIATSAITGTASKLQYETGTSTLFGGGDTSPVDGTGGSVTGVTFTRNTSTPLVGVASFDLGKDANNRQGTGVSTDFTINSVDKNTKLQISFIYQGSSGMVLGNSSDAQVFVYDIGNATMIPVLPKATIAGPVSTAKTFVGTFTSTASSTYRLIVHISTTSATAWDLLLDSVTINDQVTASAATQVPSVVIQGQPISGSVTDHMVVMWTDSATQWVPATVAGAAIPVFGTDSTMLGFATNIIGSVADIYVKGFMDGFSFGPFLGYEQYIDVTAGNISPLPSPFTDLYVRVGKSVTSTGLNIDFSTHVDLISNGSGVPVKGGILTSSAVNDATGDVVLSPGANGTFLVANSAAAKGLNYRVLASADIPNNAANTTGSAATLTTARTIAGTSFNGSANISLANKFIVQGTSDAGLSSPQFLGALGTGIVKNTTTTGVLSIAVAGDFPTLNQNTSGSAASFTGSLAGDVTGTQGATAISAATVTGKLLTGYVSGSGTVAATDTILQGIQKLNGNDILKANSASPTFTGTVTLPASNLVNSASAATNALIVYKDGHIKSTMTTGPTSVVAAGAGTGATCTIAHASDSAGIITITTGSVGTPSTGTQCNLTFNKAYATIPVCVFTPANSNAGQNLVLFSAGTSTTALQPLSFGVAGGTSTAYIYNYLCMETQ